MFACKQIPAELGLLTQLTDLMLATTKLSGTIPTELGNMGNVTFWWFRQNPLITGSLPTEIGMMSSMFMLDLRGSESLTGTVSDVIRENGFN